VQNVESKDFLKLELNQMNRNSWKTCFEHKISRSGEKSKLKKYKPATINRFVLADTAMYCSLGAR